MAEPRADDQKLGKGLPAGNNEGPGKSKQAPRKRVSQACDRCRSRKDKCDGKKPACSTCISNGRECSYDANVKKRGLPEGYVRGLEKLWGLAIRDVDAIEDNMLASLTGDERNIESPLTVWTDESNSEALVDLWRKSQISRELERLLSSQEPSPEAKRLRLNSDALAPKRIDRLPVSDYGQSSTSRPKTSWSEGTSQSRVGQKDNESSPNLATIPGTSGFSGVGFESILSPSPAHMAVSTGTPAAAVEFPDLPSETWHLLDVYFSYTHAWLPIIEKHDLLRTSYQYSQNRGTSSLSGSGSGDHAVLWAAIAYAKFQHRAINNIPRALGPVGEMVWTAERMYSQARSLIPNEEGNLELGHVQALLVLTLANMGMGHYSRAWSLIGQAVRFAIDLQLGQPKDASRQVKARSKHVFLGCFVLDTIIAARLDRRPHLRTNDVDNVGPIDEDGLEEWDPWTDCLNVRRNQSSSSRVPASILSTFNRLIQVLRILNEATCLPNGPDTLPLSTALLEKLHIWSQSQSSTLYFDSSAANTEAALSLLPHQYHLHNIYFTTLATSQLLSHRHARESINLEQCTRSARHIVDLLNQHSDTFGLLIVPPTYEYFVKSAYDIVHDVNSSIEHTHITLNDWKRNLDNCLDAMEPAWPVFEIFKASTSYQSQSARRESQVAFELLSGMNTDSDTSMSGKTPQSMASYDALDPFSPRLYRQPAPEAQQPTRLPIQSTKLMGSQTSQHRNGSFGQSTGNGLPSNPLSIYENAHAVFGGVNRQQLNKAAAKPSNSRGMTSQPSIDLTQPANPQLHRSLTMSSADVEFDPMFNELMRLDATEWTGNWDQSLVNLGFTDTDNMNQDFYAFCQEPDPLHQNNVFQQLVANSNAETTDFFDGSAFGGMNPGMGNFTPVFGDESEGIEAGQILQALSAAEDQRSARASG